jgi:hypothetical protein
VQWWREIFSTCHPTYLDGYFIQPHGRTVGVLGLIEEVWKICLIIGDNFYMMRIIE